MKCSSPSAQEASLSLSPPVLSAARSQRGAFALMGQICLASHVKHSRHTARSPEIRHRQSSATAEPVRLLYGDASRARSIRAKPVQMAWRVARGATAGFQSLRWSRNVMTATIYRSRAAHTATFGIGNAGAASRLSPARLRRASSTLKATQKANGSMNPAAKAFRRAQGKLLRAAAFAEREAKANAKTARRMEGYNVLSSATQENRDGIKRSSLGRK